MVASYTISNRLVKQGTGDNLNTWGVILNAGAFDMIDSAISGYIRITLSGTRTLSTNNGAPDEARNAVIELTGSGGTLIIPSVSKVYLVRNSTTGSVVVTTNGPVTTVIPSGQTYTLFCDGSAVRPSIVTNYAGLQITGISTPTQPDHPANKAYADFILQEANNYTDAVATQSGNLPNQTGNAGKILTTDGTQGQWITPDAMGFLTASGNLSGLANIATARANLGLGTVSTRNIGTTAGTAAAGDDSRIVGAVQRSLNGSDFTNPASVRANLGLGTAATQTSESFLRVSENLNDLPDNIIVRRNLIGLLDLVGKIVFDASGNAIDSDTTLVCDGRAIFRTGAFARLFASIGTTWGAGDGSTTFNLPDARNMVLRGDVLDRLGPQAVGGHATGTYQSDAVGTFTSSIPNQLQSRSGRGDSTDLNTYPSPTSGSNVTISGVVHNTGNPETRMKNIAGVWRIYY